MVFLVTRINVFIKYRYYYNQFTDPVAYYLLTSYYIFREDIK